MVHLMSANKNALITLHAQVSHSGMMKNAIFKPKKSKAMIKVIIITVMSKIKKGPLKFTEKPH